MGGREQVCGKCGHVKSYHVNHGERNEDAYTECRACVKGKAIHDFVGGEFMGLPIYREELPQYEQINHPDHYGGKDNPYEHIKVCEALGWGYHIGGATKYLWRMGKKPGADMIVDLDKAIWLLNRLKQKLEAENEENARDSNPSPR